MTDPNPPSGPATPVPPPLNPPAPGAATAAAGPPNGVAPASPPPTPDITSADITMTGGVKFVPWFNSTFVGKKKCVFTAPSAQAHTEAGQDAFSATVLQEGFNDMWNNIPLLLGGKQSATLLEFVTLFTIPYNETGGSFRPVREAFFVNYTAYYSSGRVAFDKDGPTGDMKAQPFYAQDRYLFNMYNKAKNGMRLAGTQLSQGINGAPPVITSNTDIAAWNGGSYPNGAPDVVKMAARECDFFKYSGLGLIQLTWRGTYLTCADPLVRAMNMSLFSATGDNSYVTPDPSVAGPPAGKGIDDMSRSDLETAFKDPTIYLPSVWAFNQLPVKIDGYNRAISEGTPAGFSSYGYRVAGTQPYGDNVYAPRCMALLTAMQATGYTVAPSASPASATTIGPGGSGSNSSTPGGDLGPAPKP
jgi:hypothetical protein